MILVEKVKSSYFLSWFEGVDKYCLAFFATTTRTNTIVFYPSIASSTLSSTHSRHHLHHLTPLPLLQWYPHCGIFSRPRDLLDARSLREKIFTSSTRVMTEPSRRLPSGEPPSWIGPPQPVRLLFLGIRYLKKLQNLSPRSLWKLSTPSQARRGRDLGVSPPWVYPTLSITRRLAGMLFLLLMVDLEHGHL